MKMKTEDFSKYIVIFLLRKMQQITWFAVWDGKRQFTIMIQNQPFSVNFIPSDDDLPVTDRNRAFCTVTGNRINEKGNI